MKYKIKHGFALTPALKPRHVNRAFEFVKGVLKNKAHFKFYLNHRRNENYILKNRGILKGFAFIQDGPYDTIILELIGTSAERGKGYGTALLKRISHDAHRRGIALIEIHDPVSGARTWYRNQGAATASKQHSNNTSKMFLPTQSNNSPSPTSRRRSTPSPNKQKSPSPRASSSSPRASPRRSANRQTPRRQTPP